MKKAPFLVGRMLSLADILHKEYCKKNRDGKVPPKLIGNSLMSVATDNPVAGLARLRERVMVYQGWASTAQGENCGLAKWTLKKMGQVAQDLRDSEIPDSTTDADQAQMLLGYLASWKDSNLEEDINPNSENEEE